MRAPPSSRRYSPRPWPSCTAAFSALISRTGTNLAFFRRVDPSCRIASGAPISTVSANPIGIDFLLDPPATIAGRVVADDGGSPIGGINVALFSGDVEVARTSTIAGGLYLISGVYPGTYRVRTIGTGPYVDEWLGNVCVGCSGAPQALTVGVGTNIIGIDFSLATGGAIEGFISCPNSVFVRGPGISAFSASGELVRVLETFCPTPPAPALYRLEGLSPGLYYLLARDPPVSAFGIRPWGGSLIDKLYGDVVCNTVDCDVRRGVPVTVTPGATTGGIDFVLLRGAESTTILSSVFPLRMFDSRGVELVGVVRANVVPPPLTWQVVGLPPGTSLCEYREHAERRHRVRGLSTDIRYSDCDSSWRCDVHHELRPSAWATNRSWQRQRRRSAAAEHDSASSS